jgi:hypothetical protein
MLRVAPTEKIVQGTAALKASLISVFALRVVFVLHHTKVYAAVETFFGP